MFTNTFLPHTGGVARSVATFAAGLRRNGQKVLIIAPTFPSAGPGEDKDLGAFRVPAIQNFNGSDFSVRLPVPNFAREWIEKFAPHIVHSHHPFLLGDTALRTARALRLPLVFTHHTLYEHYTHYVPFDSELLKSFVISLSTEYANLCDGVIAPSRSVAELLRARGVKREIEEIPTGVDIEFFARGSRERSRQDHRLAQDVPLIGHVGRLAKEKNLPFLARAVSIYLSRNKACRFLIVGRGDAEKSIQNIFSETGVSEQVIMAGELQEQKLADAYQAMDIFVFASHSETQGLVLAEAMAAGTPVVALDASGAREVVEDGRNGRLLAGNASEDEFASAIEEFFHDNDRLEEFRRRARQRAQLFSQNRSANMLTGFYQKIIDRCGIEQAAAQNDIGNWVSALQMLKTEWELLHEKMSAMHAAVSQDRQEG